MQLCDNKSTYSTNHSQVNDIHLANNIKFDAYSFLWRQAVTNYSQVDYDHLTNKLNSEVIYDDNVSFFIFFAVSLLQVIYTIKLLNNQ